MAGIRGAKNPFPTKGAAGPSGVFNQKGTGGPFMNKDVLLSARSGDRKGPPSGRNSGTSAGTSHYVNGGLKRGTAG
jgi:hypothetical protein